MTVPFIPRQAWIVQNSSTTGFDDFELAEDPPVGASYFPFRHRFADGATVPTYWVTNNNPTAKGTKWEKYRGETLTYGPPLDSLSRDNLEASTNSDGPVNWQASDLPLLIYIVPDDAATEFAVTMGLGATRPDALRYGLWSEKDGEDTDVDLVHLFDGEELIPMFSVARVSHRVINLRIKTTAFTSNGTWTPDENMVAAKIEAWGGGGGGGGIGSASANVSAPAGGGQAGGYSRKNVSVASVGASESVTIGAGGTGGTTTNPGAAGGDTSVGTLCVAVGGAGGAGAAGGLSTSAAGGRAITTGTGDVTAVGQPGGSVIGSANVGNEFRMSGAGGSSLVGAGGRGIVTSTAANGESGTGKASGGSGASSYNNGGTASGGNGTAGYVLITEYCRV